MEEMPLGEKPADWSKRCFVILILGLIVAAAGWYVLYQDDQRMAGMAQALDAHVADLQNQLSGIQKQLNETTMQSNGS